MEEADVVDQQSVARVRAITRRNGARAISVSILAGLGGALLGAAIVYAVYGAERLASTWFALAAFPAIGAYQAVHWWRRYRSILRQLDSLEARVASGEIVYGSQVKFHSYH